jgi:membrane protein YqaA with SNARE-associated domain
VLQNILDFLMDFGAWGLFIHSFADAVIFPIPAFFLQVPLSMINPSNALWLATVGYLGSLLGTPFGYLIGKLLGKTIMYKFLKKEWVDSATAMFQKNGDMAVLVGSFTPIPFKVFTILSGGLNFPLWRLIAFASIGRAVKFYVVGTLFYLYGNAAEGMVKDVSLYIFLAVIPIAFVVWLWKRRKGKKRNEEKTSSLSN